MANGFLGIPIGALVTMLLLAMILTSIPMAWGKKAMRLLFVQCLQPILAALALVGLVIPASAEILSPPSINGAFPTATANIGGTTSGTANNGSLTNLGQLGSYNFSVSTTMVRASAASPIQWNSGYNFVNTTTLQFQHRYAYFLNQTTNAPIGDAGYAAHTIQFNQAVKGLRFRWQGIDFGDDIEIFAFNGATVVPVLASYYTINGGEKSAYTPRVNRFDAASALDSNAVGIRAIDPTTGPNSGLGFNTSVDFVFPSTVAITRVLVRNGKSNISNGNVTTQLTNLAWEVETVKVQKISAGGTGTFGFSGVTNLASTPASIATATAGVAAPAAPTSILATALNADLTITESAAAGYTLTGFSCTDANSAVTGNTGTFGSFVSATRVGTIPAARVVQGATFTCQFTNTRSTVKVQKLTLGGSGTFTFNTPVNIASAPVSIGPTVAGVASPASPAAINVTNLGANINFTEAPVAGFVMTGFSCTDANSASNGNTGTFGTFVAATGVVTIPAANVVTGSDINCVVTNTKSPTISLTKALGSNRVANSDQFIMAIRTGGVAGTVVNATGSSTTTGTGSTVTGGTGTTGTFTATAGTAYTLTENASGTTNFAQYDSTITCTDSAGLQTGLPSGAAYTVASGLTITPVAGAAISCTLTNTAKAPTLAMTKSMSGNRVANSDQFVVAIRTGGVAGTVVNVTTNSTTTGTGSTVTGGTGSTGTFTATAGTAYTLTESTSGTTTFAQYNTRLVCSDSAGLQAGLPTGGIPFDTAVGFTVTPVAGAVISCSLINSAKAPTIAMTKALGSNRVANTDQFTVAIRTGGVAGTVVNVTTNSTTTGATNVVTGGTGTTGTFTATAGTAYTLTESTSGTTNFAQYDSTITCTDSASLQTGLPSGAAYTVATGLTITPVAGAVISCTLTNTAKAPTLAMTKALGSNRVANTDQFTVAIRTGGVAGTVVNVTTNSTTNGVTNVVTGGTGTTGTFTATAGTAYTLTESTSGTTNFAQYSSTITCTDSAALQTGLPSGAAYTVATGLTITPVAGAVISCTLTNTAKAPTLAMTKALGSNRVANSDQFTVAIRTGGVAGTVVNVTTNSTTAGTGSTVTSGTGTTGTFTAAAGTAYTLTESASGTTNFAQYTSTITCTDSASLQTGLPSGAAYTVATGLTLTPVAGAVISCTLTNTANDPILTLAKVVVNTGGGTAVATDWTLEAAGPTPLSGTTGNVAVTSVSVSAGAYTLSETGGPADINGGAADYSASTYSCVVNGAGAVSGNSITLNLGDTTVCTITNTFVPDANLTFDKRPQTGTPTPLQVNQVVTYEFEVTNDGNVPITGVTINETAFNGSGAIGSVSPPNGTVTLNPGQTQIFTATYTVTQADIETLQP